MSGLFMYGYLIYLRLDWRSSGPVASNAAGAIFNVGHMPFSNTKRGIVYMLVACVFFALMALFTRLLDSLPVAELIFFRALLAAAFCFIGIQRAGISHGAVIDLAC